MRTIGLYHKWQMAHIFLFRTRLCESAAATMSFKITKNLLKFIHKMNPEPTTHQPNVLIPFKWFAFRFIFVTLNNLLCISNAHKVHFFRVALSFFLLNLWLQSTDTYVNHTTRSPGRLPLVMHTQQISQMHSKYQSMCGNRYDWSISHLFGLTLCFSRSIWRKKIKKKRRIY